MFFGIRYLHTWLIIKKKRLLNRFFSSQDNYTPFVIVCAPRSGSNWLLTLLTSHPNIVSNGEILRRTLEEKPSQPLSSIEKLTFHAYHKSIHAVGLKLFYQYATDEHYRKSFEEVVNNPNISIIHLTREDRLAQYVSLKKAEHSQKWSQSSLRQEKSSIHIDREDFITYQKDQIEITGHIKGVFKNHNMIEITYEQMIARPDEILEKVQKFLKVRSRKLFSLLQKQSSGSIKIEIENWTDFKKDLHT